MAGRIKPIDYITPAETREIRDAIDRHAKTSARYATAAIIVAVIGIAVAIWLATR